MYICFMSKKNTKIITELEFYTIVVDKINNIITGSKTTTKFKETFKEISLPSYNNILSFIRGKREGSIFSPTKIKRVCEELDISYEGVHFEIKE